ncbi:MAG: hypothetical protein H7Z75_15545 [Ferruginibacter sp.]|nr:hypothetical protein [Cytophagales bacterium]
MNDNGLEMHVRLIGATQILLALLHLTFRKRFDWESDLSQLTLLNRQVFYAHTFFIAFTVFLMGLLSLLAAKHLIVRSPLGTFVAAGMGLFWLARLYCQFFYYDKRLWANQPFNTAVHIAFGFAWIWYTLVYGTVFLRQIGLLRP